ncbi:MAG: SpoIID/LytB domain-containing protein [Planctomycetes bacterium]|nr:SpoIID/LytB domain-containing protein [Planctomycetota bacterium]MCP4772186.1 SpoIID/LytB domain-containing protein [Planctomycetota bacterium]MCP4861242.1 SpoIID/LytB domain-containing protein [Planctomycetota bacterium]
MNHPGRNLAYTLALLLVLWGASYFWPSDKVEDIHLQPALLNPTISVELTALRKLDKIGVEILGRSRLLNADDSEQPVLKELHAVDEDLYLTLVGPQLGPYIMHHKHVILEAEGDGAMRLNTYFYPGRLHIRVKDDKDSPLGKRLHLSLELPLEDYVLGVVCGEMSSQVPGSGAALRAQAVAARTYALYRLGQGRNLRDNTTDQVFQSIDFVTEEAREAVAATRGQVLRWENELVHTFFHRNCGGGTANAKNAAFSRQESAPLGGVFEPSCRSPRALWEHRVPASDLDALAVKRELGSWLRAISVLQKDPTGRYLEVRLLGPDDHVDLPADQMRAALHIPSTQIEQMDRLADGSLIFRGYGYGHGVGLCQEGALRLSQDGATYAGILAHYYPSAQLVPLTADLELLLP